MPEHLRALVVIVLLASVVFAIARAPACAVAMTAKDFARRRNLWFGLTLIAFLAHNFWLYIALAGAVLFIVQRQDENKMALYLSVLMAVPTIPKEIPGLGLVNYLFEIDYVRLLALTVLLPAYLALRKQGDVARFGSTLADKLLAGYLALQVVQMFEYAPFTTILRKGVFYGFVDVFLPYYVASRYLKTLAQFREALMAFGVAALVLSVILFFEFARYWLLYPALEQALGTVWGWNGYLTRGANLRASGPIGHAIAAGYVVAIAFGLFIYLRKAVPNPRLWLLGMAVLGAGLLAPVSRGPWVGAAAIVLFIVATGPAPVVGLAKLGLAALVVLPMVLLSPAGGVIIDHLPFIGTVDASNVAARQRLAEVSWQVFLEAPFLGRYDFIETPAMQALRGSDGIIDLVNTYVVIGLSNGMVGLVLFLGVFIAVALPMYVAMRRLPDKADERYLLGQSLIGVLAGILITIATVSPVLLIPTLYWCMAGLGVGYLKIASRAHVPQEAAPAAPPVQRLVALARLYR